MTAANASASAAVADRLSRSLGPAAPVALISLGAAIAAISAGPAPAPARAGNRPALPRSLAPARCATPRPAA